MTPFCNFILDAKEKQSQILKTDRKIVYVRTTTQLYQKFYSYYKYTYKFNQLSHLNLSWSAVKNW